MSTIYKNGTPYLGITQAQDMSVQVGDNTLNLQSAIQNILGDFAPIESNPVSKAYTVGQYLIFNGNLYKVTTDIAQGGTLVIGTNVQATTVNNELINLGAAAYQGVANNLSTTTEGSVLDARQGKVLNDNIASLNSNTTTVTISQDLMTLINCTGTIASNLIMCTTTTGTRVVVDMFGRITFNSFVRTGSNPRVTFQTSLRPKSNFSTSGVGMRFNDNEALPEMIQIYINTSGLVTIQTTESYRNAAGPKMVFMVDAYNMLMP